MTVRVDWSACGSNKANTGNLYAESLHPNAHRLPACGFISGAPFESLIGLQKLGMLLQTMLLRAFVSHQARGTGLRWFGRGVALILIMIFPACSLPAEIHPDI